MSVLNLLGLLAILGLFAFACVLFMHALQNREVARRILFGIGIFVAGVAVFYGWLSADNGTAYNGTGAIALALAAMSFIAASKLVP